jgi:hypothetical protein
MSEVIRDHPNASREIVGLPGMAKAAQGFPRTAFGCFGFGPEGTGCLYTYRLPSFPVKLTFSTWILSSQTGLDRSPFQSHRTP